MKLDFNACCGAEHAADLAAWEKGRVPVAHHHSSWPCSDSRASWLWVRASETGSGNGTSFAVEVTRSRALPGTRIARIERLGRGLHEKSIPFLGSALSRLARELRFLQRLDVQVFDEDPVRRQRLGESILAAGAARILPPRHYRRTILLDVHRSREAFHASLGTRARRNIQAFRWEPATSIDRIRSSIYLDRVTTLYKAAFRRTGADAPPIRVQDLFKDALSGVDSNLIGAFIGTRSPPDDLIGFAWSRFHGDHVCYDVAAMDRQPDIARLSPGYALIDSVAEWGRTRGAAWMDMGGIIEPDSPADHPLRGITEFKQSFSRTDSIVADEYRFIPPTPTAIAAAALRGALSRLRGG